MTVLVGDCRKVMRTMADNSVDAIVTDPPYELGFMGKSWDSTGVAYDVTVWQECLRVLKPGGHLLAFGGSRTYHRLAVAIEDAGFQIRDQIMWVYGSGFPKSLNISKAIDKAAGAEREVVSTYETHDIRNAGLMDRKRSLTVSVTAPATAEAKEWNGWGTALKPAHEPIVVARKAVNGTIAQNVMTWGTGGINIDDCRVAFVSENDKIESTTKNQHEDFGTEPMTDNTVYGDYSMVKPTNYNPPGRWPANFIHDGSDEVVELFPEIKGGVAVRRNSGGNTFGGDNPKPVMDNLGYNDSGSAARFFYCAKASKKDRNEGLDQFEEKQTLGGGGLTAELKDDGSYETASAGGKFGSVKAKQTNHHPTVKPTDLMRYLCRLITPPNGTVLDPFTGSGSTGKAATLEGFNFIGIEQSAEYAEIANARINYVKENK